MKILIWKQNFWVEKRSCFLFQNGVDKLKIMCTDSKLCFEGDIDVSQFNIFNQDFNISFKNKLIFLTERMMFPNGKCCQVKFLSYLKPFVSMFTAMFPFTTPSFRWSARTNFSVRESLLRITKMKFWSTLHIFLRDLSIDS